MISNKGKRKAKVNVDLYICNKRYTDVLLHFMNTKAWSKMQSKESMKYYTEYFLYVTC